MSDTTWRDRCRAAGGFPTVFPLGPDAGAPACRFGAGAQLRYEAADESIGERISRTLGIAGETIDKAAGAAVDARDSVIENTKGAVPALLGHVLGIPSWAVLALAGYVGWHVLNAYLPRR